MDHLQFGECSVELFQAILQPTAVQSFSYLSMSVSVADVPRSSVPVASEEHFDVLNEQGQHTGQHKLRALVHRDGNWHRAVHIWVVHPQLKQLLIQLRAPDKDSYPDCWDVGCAGHLSAGEVSEQAVRAELAEELGITVATVRTDSKIWDTPDQPPPQHELLYLSTMKRELISQAGRFIDREFVDVYLLIGCYEVEQMKLQKEEVSAVQYISVEEYVHKLTARQSDYVAFPDLIEYNQQIFKRIQTLVDRLHQQQPTEESQREG